VPLLQSESLSGKCAKLHTVAACKNGDHEFTLVITISKYYQLFTSFISIIRGHSPRSLHRDHSIIACLCHIYMARWMLFFAHIPFVVNRTFSATPTGMLQHHFGPCHAYEKKVWHILPAWHITYAFSSPQGGLWWAWASEKKLQSPPSIEIWSTIKQLCLFKL